MITWRTELHYACDCYLDKVFYNPNCIMEQVLDQRDAKTKKGMASIMKKNGWVKINDKCYCKSCFKKGNNG